MAVSKVDYTQPSPHEIAKLGRRYSRTSGGNQSRTWRPSKYRMAAVRAIVFGRDDFTCQICGLKPDHPVWLSLDHIKPYKDGGLFYPDNLQTLCHSCNSRKGART